LSTPPPEVLSELFRLATDVVSLKKISLRRQLRRLVSKNVFLKQYEGAEDRIVDKLAPVFEEQIKSIAAGLAELGDTKEVKVLLEKWRAGQPRDDHGRFAGSSEGGSFPAPTGLLYHGTSEQLVSSIMEKGLLPRDPGSEGHYSGLNQPRGVYGTTKGVREAAYWARTAAGIDRSKLEVGRELKLVVFECGVSAKSLKEDPLIPGAKYSENKIDPSSFRAVWEVTSRYTEMGTWKVTGSNRREVVEGKLKSDDGGVLFVPFIVDPEGLFSESEDDKSFTKSAGDDEQWYARENETKLARKIGGTVTEVTDVVDVVLKIDGKLYGIELKTLLDNHHSKIKVDPTAGAGKEKWERNTGGTIHTVVFDDSEVVPGKTRRERIAAIKRKREGKGSSGFDTSKRVVYYKRGWGSFRLGGMAKVDGWGDLKRLMTAKDEKPTKSLQTQSDPAHTLIQLVFDPTHWKDELINRALPLLAVEMAKAARAQMSEVGIIPQKGTNGELDEKYTPGQSRDDLGRWSSGGGVGGSAPDTGGSFGSSTTSMTATKRNEEGKLMLEDGSPLPGHLPKAIPPAWRDVKVSLNPKSELLVKAKDSKDRVKVIYSDAHDTRTAIAKFARINELRKKQRMIESQVIQDGMGKGKKKEEANCLRLILATGMRPGSHSDTKGDVQAYGATTLQGRHVVVKGDTVSLSYVGKGGKKVDMVITHKAVVKDLIRRKQKAGDEGELFNTNNGKVLRYSKGLNGGGFKTKDFRTAKGTNEALKAMRNVPKPKTMKEYKKAVRKVAKHVSEKLNNTPTVALQSYINPMVFSKWRVNGKS